MVYKKKKSFSSHRLIAPKTHQNFSKVYQKPSKKNKKLYSSFSFWKGKSTHTKSLKKRIILFLIYWFLTFVVIFSVWWKVKIHDQLPDVTNIKNMVFSQATIITDRNDKELYKIFQENRDYVDLSGINKNMINAIVAVEDQRYWEHWGLDSVGIVRMVLKNIVNPGGGWGASTISQQLLKNLFLNKDFSQETTLQKVERKFKEFALASKLQNFLESDINKKYKWLSADAVQTKMKEQILELYLNYIGFWNNSYWIEAASKTYFGVSAENLWIFEASVLASLPKGPTRYNPYTNKNLVVGKLELTYSNGETAVWSGKESSIVAAVKEKLLSLSYDWLNESSILSKMTDKLNFTTSIWWTTYSFKYIRGRKDLVLARMLEDQYITKEEFDRAVLMWLTYVFKKQAFPIKAPHFVFWIIDQLSTMYDEETIQKWWLVIKTSLDLDIQNIAEEAIKINKERMDYYGANNGSMVYLDSTNGDVLAYIGSYDYFDVDIEWQNDMIRSSRQVGSSMKPFVYALGLEKLWIAIDTPMFDIPFSIGEDVPNNSDINFLGLLPLKYALAYSRNIPAIKMFYAIWWESVFKPFIQSLWISSASDETRYGYPLVLWAAEIQLLELSNAYMHLSALGKPAYIDPILEIRSSDGSILHKKQIKYQPQKIQAWVAYLLRSILSNSANMPSSWVGAYAVNWLKLAMKSGTSNMVTPKWSRARDGVLATYTPSRVALFWWGNTDGSAMYQHAYGWFLNAKFMTSFWSQMLKNNYVTNESLTAQWVSSVEISKISGWLPTDNTPSEFVVNSLAYAYSLPNKSDTVLKKIEYDISCNGLVSPYTSKENIRQWYLISPNTFMPNQMDLADIKQWWLDSANISMGSTWLVSVTWDITYNYPNVLTQEPTQYCEGLSPEKNENIDVSIVRVGTDNVVGRKTLFVYSAKSNVAISKFIVKLDGETLDTFEYTNKDTSVFDSRYLDFGSEQGNHTLELLAVDVNGAYNTTQVSISIQSIDREKPYFRKDKAMVKQEDDWYTVSLFFDDRLSYVTDVIIKQESNVLTTSDNSIANFVVSDLGVVWVSYKDVYNNTMTEEIDLKTL